MITIRFFIGFVLAIAGFAGYGQTVTFTSASQSSIDETGTMTITAELSGVIGDDVTVPFTVNGSSTATGSGTDYSITGSPVTITAGSTTADITITIATDALDEDNETVVVDMGTPTNATQGATTTHTATITDDDAAPTVTFTSASQSSIDETGTLTITAELSGVIGDDVTVPFTVNGSSTATGSGTDYSITGSPVTISAGSTTADITITIATDALDEDNETVVVDMGTPTNATQGATTTHTATITDDDAAPTVTFTSASQSSIDETGTLTITTQLSTTSGKDVTVPFTVNGSSTATGSGTDYSITGSPVTISAGSTTADITITIATDALDEDNETVVVDMGTPTNATQGATTTHTATITDDDAAPTVTFTSASQSSIDETGTLTITAELSGVIGDDVTVPFTVNGSSTATGSGTDYSITGSPVTITAGSTTADITITIATDALDEDNETVVVDMGTLTNATQGATTTHTATITDDDAAPTVTFTSASQSSIDETGTLTITTQLSTTSGKDVTVPFTVNGSSTATGSGTDYSITGSPVTISAGSTTADITITIATDALDEDNETVVVDMGTPTNATQGATTTHTATITDDDAAPTVTFTSASQSSIDETGTLTITTQLSTTSGKDVTVPFTVNGSSTATGSGTDYSITGSPVTISAGSTTADITITIATDALDEDNETVVVDMGTPTNAAQGATTTHTATITDDDAAPTVTFTSASQSSIDETGTLTITTQLSTTSGKDVTVPFTVNGSSTATGSGTDYSITGSPVTITAGSTTADITITIATDALDEANETVVVDMGTPTNATQGATTTHTATITDDDAAPIVAFNSPNSSGLESVSSADLQVDLSVVSGLNVSVEYAVTGTATGGGTDYTLANGTLVISAGDQLDNITIGSIVDDLLDEDNETVIVTLSNPVNATLGANTVHTYTITDNDIPPTVTLSVDNNSIVEASGVATLTATLSSVSGRNVTIDLGFTGTATGSGSDYTASSNSITITAGDPAGTATITAVQDTDSEADETVIVDISSITNGTESGTQQETVTIFDDDSRLISIDVDNSIIKETSGMSTITATLTGAVSEFDIVVNLGYTGTATGSGTDYSVSANSLTISAGNSSETAIISAVDDGINEVNETVIVDITSVSNSAEDGVQQLTVTIDGTTQSPTLLNPATNSHGGSEITVDFNLPEAAKSGSVLMTFSRTSGANDNHDPHEITFASSVEGAGSHNITLYGPDLTLNSDLTTNTYVESVQSIASKHLLIDGAFYEVQLEYNDILDNPAASVLNTNFYYESLPFEADIIDVSPDPTNAAIGVATIHFNKGVDTTTVDNTDFELILDEGSGPYNIDISSLSVNATLDSVFSVNGDDYSPQFTMDLSSFTTKAGSYVLTLPVSSGLLSPGGTALYANASDAWVIDKAKPNLNSVSISSNNSNPSVAGAGSIVTLSFTASEELQNDPVVTINGHGGTDISVAKVDGSPLNWTASYVMGSSNTPSADVSGDAVTFNIQFSDLAGNAGNPRSTTTNSSSVLYDNSPPILAVNDATNYFKSDNSTNTSYARVGDVLTLIYTSNEAIKNVEVVMEGITAVTTNSGNSWTSQITVPGTIDENAGLVNFTIVYYDLAGNAGPVITEADYNSYPVTIDVKAPSSPSKPDLIDDFGLNSSDNITSSTNPNIQVSADAGVTVVFYSNVVSGNLGTATEDSTGWYSLSPSLAGGGHIITATATDATGNISTISPSLTMTIDTTSPGPPTIPDMDAASDTGLDDTDNITSVEKPKFAGTTDGNARVNVYVDGTFVDYTNADIFGVWTFTPTTKLSSGGHVITVKAYDLAGNESDFSAGLSIEIDTDVPAIPSTPDLDASTDTGADFDNFTKIETPIFKGTADKSTLVKLYRGTGPYTLIGSAIADGTTGDWTITSSSLSLGLHEISATATDLAGNESAKSIPLQVTIDNSIPNKPATPELDTLSDSGAFNNDRITGITTPKIKGTAESDSYVKIYTNNVLGDSVIATGGNYEYTFATLTAGTYSINVIATDKAGNSSISSNVLVFTIDDAAPDLSTIHFASNNSRTELAKTGNNVSLTFTSDEEIQTPTVFIDGLAVTATGGPTFWTATRTLDGTENEGTLPFSIQYTDIAGNDGVTWTTTTDASEVEFDKTEPDLTSISIASDHTNTNMARVGSEININFTSSDSIERITVKVNNKPALVSSVGINEWEAISYMSSTDPVGEVSFAIDYKDLAGNSGPQKTATTDASKVTFDKVSPTFSSVLIYSNNADTSYAIEGDVITLEFETSEAVETPLVEVNSLVPSISGGPTNWIASRTAVAGENEGVIPFTIDISDLAGNSAATKFSSTDGSSVTYDDSNPGISAVTVNPGTYKVGDVISVLINADGINYEGSTVEVNGKTQTLTNNLNNTYSISYLIEENDTEHAGVASLPVNIVLRDPAGLITSRTSAAVSGGLLTIDSKTPVIASFSSNAETAGHALIGDNIIFSLTPAVPETGLIILPDEYNGSELIWETIDGSSYTAIYEVKEGDDEQATPLQPDQIVLSDAAGNNDVLTYSAIAKKIFTEYPSVTIAGSTSKCDYGQTVPISFQFTGRKPFSLTYNDGSQDIGPVSIDGMNYTINEVEGTFTLVNLTDSTGNFVTDALVNAEISVIPRPEISTNYTKSPYNIESEKDELSQYVIEPDKRTGIFSAPEGITYSVTDDAYYFEPKIVPIDLRDKSMQILYTFTDPVTGCFNVDTNSVFVSSTAINIAGLKSTYCETEIADTILGNLPTEHAGLYELFSKEGEDTVAVSSGSGWVQLASKKMEIRPEELPMGDYFVKYTALKLPLNEVTEYVTWKSFSIEAIRTGIQIEGLESEYCFSDDPQEIAIGLNFEPAQGDIGTFTGPGVFIITPESHTAKFKYHEALPNEDYTLKYVYESEAGCIADPVYHTIHINPLPVLSFNMESNYNFYGDTIPLTGVHPEGVYGFSGPGVKGSAFIPRNANISTAGFTAANMNVIRYSGNDQNGCFNDATDTTWVYQSTETINGINPKGVYCYDENTVLDLSCESDHSDTITGTFRSRKLGVLPPTGKNSAQYAFKDVAEGLDTIYFEYKIASTLYTVMKPIVIDGFSYVDISVADDDYDFCNSEGLKTFNSKEYYFDGREYNEGLRDPSFTFISVDGETVENASTFELNTRSQTPGAYLLRYSVTSSLGGCTDLVEKEINIYPEPVTDFKWEINCPLIGTEVPFVNLTTIEGDEIEAYKWEFAGTALADTTIANPKYSFASNDFKSVRLTAISKNRCAVESTKTIQIGNSAKANFTWDNECNTGDVVNLESTSIGGDVSKADYKWTIDGSHTPGDTLRTSRFTYPDVGVYDVKLAYTSETNCTDSVTRSIAIQPYIRITDEPDNIYLEEFESGNSLANWQASSLWEDSVSRWNLGMPVGDIINKPASGDHAWYTKLTDRENEENSQVVSPCFDLSGLEKPMIKLNIWSQSEESRDGAILQYSTDYGKNWNNLGVEETADGVKDGINWFNTDFIQSQPAEQYVGWNYPPMMDWVSARHNLDMLKNNTVVRFRIAYANDGGGISKVDGFAFDDVWIGERQQNVLAEYFTNSTISASQDANTNMATYQKQRAADLIPIHYHTEGDPIYKEYKEGPSSRVFYYGISTVPGIIANGGGFSNLSQSAMSSLDNMINLETLKSPKLLISASINKTNADITITSQDDLSGESMVLYTAIVKDSVVVNDVKYDNVISRFLPSPGGTILDATEFTQGETINKTVKLNLVSSTDYHNSKLVLFVQNAETKQVYQSVSIELNDVINSLDPEHISILVDLYPNPASNQLFIDSEYKIEQLVVLDISGRIIEHLRPNQSRVNISVGDYKEGIYFIKGKTNEGEFMKKFIKH